MQADVAKQSFGHIGSAGGHKSMARAEIPVSSIKDILDPKNDEKILKWIIAQVNKKAGKK